MSFADGAKAQDKAKAAVRHTGLIRMGHDARIEQRRGFKRILIEKVGPHQLPLHLGERSMIGKRLLHLLSAYFERLQQIAVAPQKILQHVGQLSGGGRGIEREHPLHNMIGAGLVRRIEIARFGCRFEWTNDDP